MIKVMQIIPMFATGGAERFLVDLSLALNLEKCEVYVVSLYPSQNTQLEKELLEKGINLHYINKKRRLSLKAICRLRKYISKIQPEIIHSHLFAILTAKFATICMKNKPIHFYTIHNIASKDGTKLSRILYKRWFRKKLVTPVAISGIVQKTILKEYHLKEVPCVYNGISLAIARNVVKTNPNCRKFITVGRLSEQKNQQLMIRAFHNVLSKKDDCELTIVGDGKLEKDLKSLVVSLNLENKVHLLGKRDDVLALLSESDLFLLSSDYEGNPISILEAMSVGLPIISTSVGGVPDVIIEMKNGLLVEPHDETQFANAILRLVFDYELRHSLSKINLNKIQDYDILLVGKHYLSLYNEKLLLKKSRK